MILIINKFLGRWKRIGNKIIKDKIKADLIYLLENKIDLKDNIEVTEKEGKEFADKNNIKFYSMSVKNNINIQHFFNELKSCLKNNTINYKGKKILLISIVNYNG